MKILVTGSSGFIGSHLSSELKRRGHSVIEVDTEIGLDLTRLNLLEYLPNDLDVIFHLAATNGTSKFYKDPTEILVNNTLSLLCFREYLLKFPDVRFVFASTCEIQNSVTDNGFSDVPTKEDALVGFDDLSNPRWSYSLPKALGENFVANISKNYLILRYFNIFGPKQTHHFLPEFLDRAISGRFEIFGNDTRSFCYINDAVEMTLTAALSSVSNETLNIGNPQETKIEDVAKLVLKVLGKKYSELNIHPGLTGSAIRRCPDISRFERFFGPQIFTPLEQAIKICVDDAVERKAL